MKIIFLQNSEGTVESELYQSNMLVIYNLACRGFMEAGRRFKASGSETKHSLILTAMRDTRISAFFFTCFSNSNSYMVHKKGQMTPAHIQWVVLQERNPELGEAQSLIMGAPAFGSGGKHPLSSKAVCSLYKHAWKLVANRG